ncbi:flagellar hook protein FlgE [Parvularcula sp. ZS-1/3]|uniref:Flagellar hook protein FlgE n=1 Tax=Parvularcula mediterranea TaxID=2732508 RepID=A0A7Y3RNN1_9PROT|nr:flagellar hook protein FlgE [Parvularcula mediterranea]NNU17419.1 flagellar hook protein FlgE [Parvularcula mediterranea]
MSIGSALQTGVNGLRAQATKLATISDNIANSSTVGYKRSTAQFSTLVINTGSDSSYTAGGVTTQIRTEVSKAGTILASDSVTDLAIAGRGFFAVANQVDGSGAALTRAGSFRPDQFGNLQNSGGFFLQGFPLNPDGTYTNGAPSLTTFDSMETVNINAIQGAARPTTQVLYNGNVPAGSAGPFQAGVQYFDEFGATQTLTFNWVPNGGAGSNVWDVEIYDGPVGGTLVTTLAGIDFTGGGAGAVAGTPDYPAAAPVAAAAGYTVQNYSEADGTFEIVLPGAAGQTIELGFGAENQLNGVTQFGGDFTPQTNVDGSALGELQQIDIQEDGTLVAIFDNGEIRPVYQIPLVDVINPEGLDPVDGNAFTLSADSGDLRVATAGTNNTGTISSGALEGANVDVAEELTTLIETQRAYSSNATIVQTADEMLEEVTRLGR